jgi:hypothetical protein
MLNEWRVHWMDKSLSKGVSGEWNSTKVVMRESKALVVYRSPNNVRPQTGNVHLAGPGTCRRPLL